MHVCQGFICDPVILKAPVHNNSQGQSTAMYVLTERKKKNIQRVIQNKESKKGEGSASQAVYALAPELDSILKSAFCHGFGDILCLDSQRYI